MCPACKIILDGGRLAAASRALANKYANEADLVVAATYLADIVTANTDALKFGIEYGSFTREQIDEAHAWSELQCHRADMLETEPNDESSRITPALLYKWAHEDRLHATELSGGEYRGAWEVNGVEGIKRKTKDE